MHNDLVVILIMVVIAMIVANSSLGNAQTPSLIKKLRPKPASRNKWLQWIPILIIKMIVGIIFLLWRLIASGIKWATPKFFKKILKGF